MDLIGELADWILKKIVGSPGYRARKLSVGERLAVVAAVGTIVVGLYVVLYVVASAMASD
jgi:hypothetical protein